MRHSGTILPMLVAGLAATATLAPTPVTADDRRPVGESSWLRLHREAPGLGVREVPIRDHALGHTLRTTEIDLVAATWRGKAHGVRVKVRRDGRWGRWLTLPAMEDLPNPADEGSTREGTDLQWVGGADAVRLRAIGGDRPRGLRLVLLDVDGTAMAASPVSPGRHRATARANPLRPALLGRKRWGADESWRNSQPRHNDRLKQVHVHHTVNGNGYSRAQVPALIRGMYRYHTKSLGWSDIGYNFLVDRFGRIWVGRCCKAWRSVRGAHTLGFNHASTGVAVIGNFESGRPARRAITGVVHLAAWKLGMHHRNPAGRTTVISHGSDQYPYGRRVVLPVVDGHRDTNDTACPGERLYAKLPAIRRRATERITRLGS